MAAEKVQQEPETAPEKVQAETEVVQEEEESKDAFELDDEEKSMIPTELKPLPDEQEFGPEMVIMLKYLKKIYLEIEKLIFSFSYPK